MYLRTTQRRNRDGSQVTYYQLAHNERDPQTKKPQAKVIHNFGRADQLDRDALVRLCCSIARVCNLSVSDPLADGASPTKGTEGLPEDLSFSRSYEYGALLVIEQLYERLGIGPAVREAMQANNCRVHYDRAILAMIANRLCEPTSKLGVWIEWLTKVYLPGTDELKLAQMYEAMDLLHEHMSGIEERVFFTTADLLNLDVDIIFYDTTTATFAIDQEDEDEEGQEALRRYGRPKEGGFAPHVIVALAVTRDGLPVRSWLFPGNTTDSSTVAKVKEDLRGWKLGRALFVGDDGMNSEDNRLDKYLKVTKHKTLELDREAVDEAAEHDGKWVVQTNDDTLTPSDAAQGYKALLTIERCFRSLKTVQLHLTPMYHWVPRRIEAHVKLCVLALLIERVAENETKQTWRVLRNFLRDLQVARFDTPSHYFFERNEPTTHTSSILKKLKITLPNKILSVTPRV